MTEADARKDDDLATNLFWILWGVAICVSVVIYGSYYVYDQAAKERFTPLLTVEVRQDMLKHLLEKLERTRDYPEKMQKLGVSISQHVQDEIAAIAQQDVKKTLAAHEALEAHMKQADKLLRDVRFSANTLEGLWEEYYYTDSAVPPELTAAKKVMLDRYEKLRLMILAILSDASRARRAAAKSP